jgi:hypothetical protein
MDTDTGTGPGISDADVNAGPGPVTAPSTTRAPADLLAHAAATGALSAGPAPLTVGPPGEPGFLPTPDAAPTHGTAGVADLSGGQAPEMPDPTRTVVPDREADGS